MANVECPFCGKSPFTVQGSETYRHPANPFCPIESKEMPVAQWQMRPPKKEQPAVTSEVEWLRALVQALVLDEPQIKCNVTYEPLDLSGIKPGPEGAGK